MACWHKQHREEVVITRAGGGCYVSKEEGWRKIRMSGGFFFLCLFCSACTHHVACCFCNVNMLIVCCRLRSQLLGWRGVNEYQSPFNSRVLCWINRLLGSSVGSVDCFVLPYSCTPELAFQHNRLHLSVLIRCYRTVCTCEWGVAISVKSWWDDTQI